MSLIDHHIYEFKKEVRKLFLHTIPLYQKEELVRKLEKEGISYFISPLNGKAVNIFFGDYFFVKVVESFGPRKMNELSLEEDFILGIMLGYGHRQQCERFLSRKQKSTKPVKEPGSSANMWRSGYEKEMQLQG